ncbi:MAG: hypothetical protein IKN46_01865 [Acholeplasmatales bacterium]|nr:hypothetical protein [Acholeplasmatales bacterium]
MKTSLEKSHSKTSNFKLTMICLIGIIGFNLIFVGLVLFNYNPILTYVLSGAGIILSLFDLFLINKFTR